MQPLRSTPALQLWCAYPADLLDPATAEACAALLSSEERNRAARFRFDRSRREFIAGRALVRTALAANHSTPAREWSFSANAHGKPGIDPGCGLSFNLTNCQELVACVVAGGAEAGIDAEPLGRAEQVLPLAPKVFSARERAQIAALPHEQRASRALSLWVLKEAYIKARGLGLAIPLKLLSFRFEGERIQLEFEPSMQDRSERWSFCLLEHAEHRLAVVVERTAEFLGPQDGANLPNVEFWEARPPCGEGRRLLPAAVRWFSSDGRG